ncbi:MAG TPA: amidohydrolase [Terriglobales bacterium]|nr:amidohydrolase [Terriglobales bacterium]
MTLNKGTSVGWVLAVIGTLSLLAAVALPQDRPAADTLVVNARIYTVNSKQPWAEALAIRDGKILAAGVGKDVEKYRGAATKVLDTKGYLLLPGFTDSHIHFLDGSFSLLRVNLEQAKTVAQIQKMVKEYAQKHPAEPWVLGRGWQYPVFAPSGLPDKKYLDEILPDRPVYLEAFDGHSWWANSKALQLAGIMAKTPDPPNGKIVRDAATGEPTGAIQEDAADAVIRRAIPLPTREEKLQALRAGLREANRVGLVRVHSAGGVNIGSSDLQNADLFDELRKRGELTVRMYLAYRLDPPTLTANQLAEIEAARRKYHDEWISAGAVKFFLDGVIESHTAAMLTPYSDDPKQLGSLFWDPAKYKQAVNRLDRGGFQIFTHAIGDKAVRLALDSYEDAARINHTKDARHRVEHIETIAAEDIPQFGKRGVIASFQPLHAYPDDDRLKIWARNVGPERAQRAWAWHSIESAGGVLAFGSDWPVVTLNPWPGVQNALTRQTDDGNPPEGFVPKERISLEDAIKAYTLGAAIAGKREKTEGSLEPGKVADLIIISQDLFKIEPSDIGKTEVMLTMVGGKVVYQSPHWEQAKSARARPAQ